MVPNTTMQYGVCTCQTGYHVVGNECVLKEDKCKDIILTDCEASCDPLTGEITNKPNGTRCTTDSGKKGLCEIGQCWECSAPKCPADNECCTLSGPEDECGYPTPVLGFKDNFYECEPCTSTSSVPTSSEECAKCEYSDTPRVYDDYGYCMSCNNVISGFYTTVEECHRCNHSTKMPRFMSNSNVCLSCKGIATPTAIADECAVCNNSETPRIMVRGLCVLPCEEGYFFGTDTKRPLYRCRSCLDLTTYTTEYSECARCGEQRVYNAETGECSLAS